MNRRTLRMRKLIVLLECGELKSLGWLAEQTGVTANSICRDLCDLRADGYRIDGSRGPGGGVMLRRAKGA